MSFNGIAAKNGNDSPTKMNTIAVVVATEDNAARNSRISINFSRSMRARRAASRVCVDPVRGNVVVGIEGGKALISPGEVMDALMNNTR